MRGNDTQFPRIIEKYALFLGECALGCTVCTLFAPKNIKESPNVVGIECYQKGWLLGESAQWPETRKLLVLFVFAITVEGGPRK